MLGGKRCRAIVAISEHARKVFLHTHDGRPGARDMLDRLTMRYPNVDVSDEEDLLKDDALERVQVRSSAATSAARAGAWRSNWPATPMRPTSHWT